jgi:hypothetical protein
VKPLLKTPKEVSEMNDNQARRFQMLVRANNYGRQHLTEYANGSRGRDLFVTLGGIVTELTDHTSAESSGIGSAREGTATRAAAREALRDDLEVINRTARAIAETTPGMDDKFRMPRGNNDQALLNAARAFAADLDPLSALFIGHELPADFLSDLNLDINNMQAAIDNQANAVEDHVAAGVAIDDSIEQGMQAVRVLDAIVRNRYANDPAKIAEWATASHVERSPRRSHPAAPSPPASEAESPPPA